MAMFSIAVFSLAYLQDTLSPLVDIWAVQRGGAAVERLRLIAEVGRQVMLAALALAAFTFIIWEARARANVDVLARGRAVRPPTLAERLSVWLWFLPVTNLLLPPVRIAEAAANSVDRNRAARLRMRILVWLWWTMLVGALAAFGAGLVAASGSAQEAAELRARVVAGEPIDASLAVGLFSREITVRLPSAVLFVLAAVLALLMIARVTNAQYARVAKLRGASQVHVKAALWSGNADWTVDLDPDRTAVTQAAAVGGTIRA
jgi:hypothetical protein